MGADMVVRWPAPRADPMTAPDTHLPPLGATTATAGRPVMLLTLDVPLDARAQRFALETALGAGCRLVLCDAVPVGPNSAAPTCACAAGPTRTRRCARPRARRARSVSQVDELIFHSPRPLDRGHAHCAPSAGSGCSSSGPPARRPAAGATARGRAACAARRPAWSGCRTTTLPAEREPLDQVRRRDRARTCAASRCAIAARRCRSASSASRRSTAPVSSAASHSYVARRTPRPVSCTRCALSY